jgi:hypothetical protein
MNALGRPFLLLFQWIDTECSAKTHKNCTLLYRYRYNNFFLYAPKLYHIPPHCVNALQHYNFNQLVGKS